MNVGILGLGLIGGSLARAYALEGHSVFAWDLDDSILSFARLAGAVHGILDDTSISECDLILLAVDPAGTAAWMDAHAASISPRALVIDCCGIKERICDHCFPLAQKYGFTFVGGHPMAGTQFSGFKYSRADLFQGAPMVLVPPRYDDLALLERCKTALAPCHLGSFSVTTGKEHDRLITFTSQMPHIVSNAFIKSPTARSHNGFSAGSYRDLTRVAWLNPPMWAQLCMENRENMIYELRQYIGSLQAYLDAFEACDQQKLTALLEEGRRRKEEVDG